MIMIVYLHRWPVVRVASHYDRLLKLLSTCIVGLSLEWHHIMIDYDNDCLPASLACRYTWHHIMIDYDNDCLPASLACH